MFFMLLTIETNQTMKMAECTSPLHRGLPNINAKKQHDFLNNNNNNNNNNKNKSLYWHYLKGSRKIERCHEYPFQHSQSTEMQPETWQGHTILWVPSPSPSPSPRSSPKAHHTHGCKSTQNFNINLENCRLVRRLSVFTAD